MLDIVFNEEAQALRRAFITSVMLVSGCSLLAASPAFARHKLHKWRTVPYPSASVPKRAVAPISDPIVQSPTVHESTITPAPRGTCGSPPCSAGSIRLEPRDIRNFDANDIRSNGQRTYYQSPGTR